MSYNKVSIIGAGKWGKALAFIVSQRASKVMLMGRDISKLDSTNLNKNIELSTNFSDIDDSDLVLVVTATIAFRSICQKIATCNLKPTAPIVICCKGIEQNTQLLMSEIANEYLPSNPIAILSGPNFADEILAGLPAATNISCLNPNISQDLALNLFTSNFRVYHDTDIVTAQLAGAYKNILAIACGITIGKNFGENARAALITRGIHELSLLCQAKGGSQLSLLSLAGIGDIVLTCTGHKSRNFCFGIEISKGLHFSDQYLNNNTVEGYYSIPAIFGLSQSLQISMPICQSLYQILYQQADVNTAVNNLLSRPLA